MIVAYHNAHVVYAYKGVFNKNIDHHWFGGVLKKFKKVVDKCEQHNGVQPAPVADLIPGITFDKLKPYWYHSGTCDTIFARSLTNPIDCRWHNCRLPSSISASHINVQMTMAIFVR